MRLTTFMTVLALTGLLSGCAAQRHGTAAAKVQRPSNPEDVDRLFGERVNAGDLEGVVALYEPTATLVRQDRSSATGTEEIRKELAQLMALKPQITMNVSRIVSDGDGIARRVAPDRDGAGRQAAHTERARVGGGPPAARRHVALRRRRPGRAARARVSDDASSDDAAPGVPLQAADARQASPRAPSDGQVDPMRPVVA